MGQGSSNVPMASPDSGSDRRSTVSGQGPERLTHGRDSVITEDRLTIQIDTDCDYMNAFQIDIDSNGAINDRQGTNLGWNPAMFVAQDGSDSQYWQVEIAIDLAELSLPQMGKPWGVIVDRQRGAALAPQQAAGNDAVASSSGATSEVIASGWLQIFDPLQMQ